MASPREVVEGLPSMQGAPIPTGVLKSYLVESGGRAFLIQNKSIPEDEHYAVMTMDINHEGTSIGGFGIFWSGPVAKVAFSENVIFREGDASVKISWDVRPRDVKFLGSAWCSKWMDGAVGIARKEILVEDVNGGDVGPIIQAYSDPSRAWSYRYVMIVKGGNQPVLTVQALPTDLASINSSPWFDTSHVSGIYVVAEDLSWFPTLTPEHNHTGPAPFLVDHRSAEAKTQDNFINSQQYRDAVVYALTRGTSPISLTAQAAAEYTPTGLETPIMGKFFRVIEQDNTNHSNKRLRTEEAPQDNNNVSNAGMCRPVSFDHS